MGDEPTDWVWVQRGAADLLGIPGIEDAVEIGRGAAGVVYRARQPEFNRDVAVKVLDPSATGQDGWQRFQRELKAMGPLSSHPGIVTVHSAGVTRHGRPFIVMELVGGGSLSAQVDPMRPMPAVRALDIGARMAGALAAAHTLGILHRDVKPANVLVTTYGDVKLADFGISRIPGGMETSAGLLFVSVNFAAPELLSGAPPSPASDLYALGATVFTLIAGHPPFEFPGEAPDVSRTLRRVAAAPLPDLRTRGVPDAVCAVLERALARDPRLRPGSAEELAGLFRSAAAAIGGTVPPGSRARWAPRWLLIAGAGAAAVIVVGVAVSVAHGRTPSGPPAGSPAAASAIPAAALRPALITASDLPGGFGATRQEPLGVNSLVVCGNPFPPTGLVDQVGAQFTAAGQGLSVESNIATFKPGLAEALLTQFAAQTRACPSFSYVVGGVNTSIAVSVPDGTTIGDQTLRLHVVEGNGLTTDSIVVRLGDDLAVVEYDSLHGSDPAAADRLGVISSDRLRTALGR